MADTGTTSTSALDQLINSLTTTIQNLSDEVNRTYGIYVLKDRAYTDALALEAEKDRQRLEKMSQNDSYNADILSEELRNTVRPAREEAGRQLTAARAAWDAAKTALALEKTKLSAAEQQLLDAKIAEATAAAQVNVMNANAQSSAIKAKTDAENATTTGKLFAQKSTQYLIIGGVVFMLVVIGVIVWKKYIKK